MKAEPTRREMLGNATRGAVFLGLGATAVHLIRRSSDPDAWQLDPLLCVNSQVGAPATAACESCASSCVLSLSAVRAVNDHTRCGRCCICPAYFNVRSAVGADGLPSAKLCPRDAIRRVPIGEIDAADPMNNYYEYLIDETLCDGCGRCVLECKEPAGLGSIRLEIRHNLCVGCNRCTIAQVCPAEAFARNVVRGSAG